MTEGSGASVVEALEIEKLRRDLADAREEIVATNEVLTAMGRSASDLDLVLGTIVDSARRLCRADGVQLHLLDGPVYRLARSSGLSTHFVEHLTAHPHPPRPRLPRRSRRPRPAHHPDRATCWPTPATGARTSQRIAGYRTIMGAPMLLDDDVVGVLSVWRTEVDPFDDRAISAPHGVRRRGGHRRPQPRPRARPRGPQRRARPQGRPARGARPGRGGRELEPRPRHGALDDRHARRAAVRHRRRLVDGVRSEASSASSCARPTGPATRCSSSCAAPTISLHDTFVGRAAMEARPLQIADMQGLTLDVHQQLLHDAGWRSMVAVPMLREGSIVGVLVMRRLRAGDFPEETLRSARRPSPASRRWRSSTRGCSASSNASPASWRWSAATSPSSSPACRTSCAPPSMPSSASRRCCSTACSARSTIARRSTSATS